MPAFTNIKVVIPEVEFEVYCAACGYGICLLTEVRTSRIRKMPQVVVEPYRRCLQKAKREGIKEGFEAWEAKKRAEKRR